ncbi:MAG: SAM-dependent chlorinase/fluorinase [Bacteroidota bacterium]
MSVIVTLTTDLGTKDYYAAVIKGAILSKRGWINVVDITHDINNYDIVQAAFVLKNAYSSFPKGSIHIAWVSNTQESENSCLVFKKDGYFFVGPDNGLFSLMFEKLPDEIFRVKHKSNSTFGIGALLPQVVDEIASKKPIREIGQQISKVVQRISLQAVTSKLQIRGSVIHIDNYENVIVNIDKLLFERMQDGRSFKIYFKRNDPVTKISKHYSEVPIGETLCLFNSAGYLEIAINMGKAAGMFGLEVDDTVQIDFDESV